MVQVLIVDDDALMRKALSAILVKFQEYHIAGEAANGLQAVEFCRKQPVDLIFMDIIMPGMTGLEAGRIIKKEFPQTEICILSACTNFHFAREALELHVKKYFFKPVSVQNISLWLKEFLKSRNLISAEVVSEAVGLADSKDYVGMYAGVSEITETLCRESSTDMDKLKRAFLTIGQILLDFAGIPGETGQIEEKFPLHNSWLSNTEVVKLWLFKVMDYVYQQKSIHRYPILEGVFLYIEQHIKEKLSLPQITEGSMISQGYLSRIFRDQFGISVMEYIRFRKIHMAKLNFVFTTNNINDVAFLLGYGEGSYLQKVFQKIEGISIQEFKNRLGEK